MNYHSLPGNITPKKKKFDQIDVIEAVQNYLLIIVSTLNMFE